MFLIEDGHMIQAFPAKCANYSFAIAIHVIAVLSIESAVWNLCQHAGFSSDHVKERHIHRKINSGAVSSEGILYVLPDLLVTGSRDKMFFAVPI